MKNILRIIKLKQIAGELDNLSEQEQLFFQLHDNFHEDGGDLCNDKNEWIVNYDFKNDRFWYHYNRFYLVFKSKFNINEQDFNKLCRGILEEHLNFRGLTPAIWF